jgi:hypothetical protein
VLHRHWLWRTGRLFARAGTDESFHSTTPQQEFGEELYRIYFRFLETEDEYFEYTPAAKPAQGR